MNHCEVCHREAPTARVTLYRNIGLLVMRSWTKSEGDLCAGCARSRWLTETTLTAFLGWWGFISFFTNWFALFHNLFQAPKVFGIPRDESPLGQSGPNVGTLLLAGLAGVVLLVAASFGYGVWAKGGNHRRAVALREATETVRREAVLTQQTACDLAELHLRTSSGVHPKQRWHCDGLFKADSERAEVRNVSDSRGHLTTVCLKKSPTRWFVAGFAECAPGALSAAPSGGDEWSHEYQWQKEEANAVVAGKRGSLEAALAALSTAEAPALCSREKLEGYLPMSGFDLKTVARAKTEPGWEFLTSAEVRQVFEASTAPLESRLVALEVLRQTKLIALVGPARVEALPKIESADRFDSGVYVGTVTLADLQTKQALCSAPLVFASSDNLSLKTRRGSDDETVKHAGQSRVTSDFESQFRFAMFEVMRIASLDEAEAQTAFDARLSEKLAD